MEFKSLESSWPCVLLGWLPQLRSLTWSVLRRELVLCLVQESLLCVTTEVELKIRVRVKGLVCQIMTKASSTSLFATFKCFLVCLMAAVGLDILPSTRIKSRLAFVFSNSILIHNQLNNATKRNAIVYYKTFILCLWWLLLKVAYNIKWKPGNINAIIFLSATEILHRPVQFARSTTLCIQHGA